MSRNTLSTIVQKTVQRSKALPRIILVLGLLCSSLLFSACSEVLSIANVSVSADGEQVAFLIQTNAGTSMALQTLNLADGSVQRIGSETAMQGAFDWNPQDGSIAFVEITADQVTNLWVAGLSDQVNVLWTELPANMWVNQLAYSPDGSTIALSVSMLPTDVVPRDLLDSRVDLNGTIASVQLLDVSSGELTEIMNAENSDTPSLDWSPDGARLAYAYAGTAYVYDVSAGTTSIVNWMENLVLRSPSWINNTRLVMVSDPDSEGQIHTDGEIVAYDVSTSATQAWAVGANVVTVAASPDGSTIAYIQGQPSPDAEGQYAATTTTVGLLPVDGDSERAIYVGVGLDRPVWSSDSSTLFVSNGNVFSMFAGNRRQLFRVDVASGAAEPVFEGALASSSLLGWSLPPEETPTP